MGCKRVESYDKSTTNFSVLSGLKVFLLSMERLEKPLNKGKYVIINNMMSFKQKYDCGSGRTAERAFLSGKYQCHCVPSA